MTQAGNYDRQIKENFQPRVLAAKQKPLQSDTGCR